MNSEATSPLDNLSFVIGSLAQHPLPLKMTAHYRGLEFNQDVHVLEAHHHYAVFQATNLPPCAMLEKTVHLMGRIFPKAVRARIIDRNIEKGILELSDFTFTDAQWVNRRSDRVQPKNPTYISFHCKQKAFRAYLEDISRTGLAILLRKNPDRNASLHPGSRVYLRLQLDPDTLIENLKGMIIYHKELDHLLLKVGIQIIPQVKQLELLENYLVTRKQEILAEVHQAYFEESQAMVSNNLFL
jgi:hypothetical protein